MKRLIHSPQSEGQESSPLVSAEMRALATYLAKLRSESGFSMREAARQSEITASYLSKIEAGETFSTISIRTILSLAKTYNTPLTLILEKSGFIDGGEHKLPLLPQYLRLKYQMGNLAIRDMEMAKEIVDKKYGTGKRGV